MIWPGSLVAYAEKFIGTPYIYGGNGPYFDCSGLLREVLMACFIHFPRRDMTMDEIRKFLIKVPGSMSVEAAEEGDFIFNGKNDKATHGAIAKSREYLIEAGGGDRTTTTLKKAYERGAMVRVRPILHRTDVLQVIRLPYASLRYCTDLKGGDF